MSCNLDPDPRPGPPLVHPSALVSAIRELRPRAIFAEHVLPGDVIVDDEPCELLRVDNGSLALLDRRVMEADDSNLASAPIVLAANVGASALGRLRHRLANLRRPSTLIGLIRAVYDHVTVELSGRRGLFERRLRQNSFDPI